MRKLQAGEELTTEEKAIGERQKTRDAAIQALAPEEAAKLSDKDYRRWMYPRSAEQIADPDTYEEIARAQIARGENPTHVRQSLEGHALLLDDDAAELLKNGTADTREEAEAIAKRNSEHNDRMGAAMKRVRALESGNGAGASNRAPQPEAVAAPAAKPGETPPANGAGRPEDAVEQTANSEASKGQIIFARHGETKLDQAGANETVAGWTPEPLDERGKAAAAKLAENIKDQKPTVIVTSDLPRAKQTAEIVGKQLGIPVTEDSRLRPQHVPETEGLKVGEATPIWEGYEKDPDKKPEGGESWNEARTRQDAALKDVNALVAKGEKPVVVTHSRNLEMELGERPKPGGFITKGLGEKGGTVEPGKVESGNATTRGGEQEQPGRRESSGGVEQSHRAAPTGEILNVPGLRGNQRGESAAVPGRIVPTGVGAPSPTSAETPKYKFGSTQANIPASSEASKALESARARISDSDLAGKGKEIGEGGNHVTVRYGIKGDDTAGIKKFLSEQSPFEATLGKTEKFPVSEHSEGAAPIIAPIEAPELHRLNAELEKHGEFNEPSFKEYKPHATVAYVDPEKADRYVGMDVTHGKKFTVDEVAITDKQGEQEVVKLEGKKAEPRRESWRSPRVAPDIEKWQAPPELGVTHAPDYGQMVRADTERRMGGPLTRSSAEVAPGKVGEMKVSDLKVAPHKFQYKLSTDAEGVGTLLKETKVWNPDLAGIIAVWRDPADGKMYVVNGHHRYELAKRLGVKSVTVRHIVAPTAKAARAIGAEQNIAEGRGTAMDAGKFFRDSGISATDLAEKGISLSEGMVAKGMALANLSEPIFNRVVQGDLTQGRAIAIGEATADPAEQKVVLDLVERKERTGKKVSDDTLSELIRLVKSSGQTTETTANLFGTQEINRSLALEKAEISAHIKQQLQRDKKLFGFVAKGDRATELARAGNKIDVEKSKEISTGAAQAEEVYNRLSERGGPIAGILEEAARKLADGDNAATVKSDAYSRVRGEVSQTLGGGEGRGPGRHEGTPENEPDTGTNLFSPETELKPTELAPPFYSKAARIAFDKLPSSGSGQSILATLKNAGVKDDEIKWIGLDDFLKGRIKVSKADVLGYIMKNMVQVREVSHGGTGEPVFRKGFPTREAMFTEVMRDDMLWNERQGGLKPGLESRQEPDGTWNLYDSKQPTTKYASYTLPGDKKNYTELLLTLPTRPRKVMDTIAKEMGFGGWTNHLTEEQKDRVIAAFDRQPSAHEPFKTSHFEEPNILAHVRFDERTDADGKPILFVEEAQSDWHQTGKKHGYIGDNQSLIQQAIDAASADKDAEAARLLERLKVFEKTGNTSIRQGVGRSTNDLINGLNAARQPLGDKDKLPAGDDGKFLSFESVDRARKYLGGLDRLRSYAGAVPNAPFKSDWHELAMKTMLRKAAEGGYDKIGWITGAQTAERYDLSKHIDSLFYVKHPDGSYEVDGVKDGQRLFSKRLDKEELEANVGKELAKKMVDGEGDVRQSWKRADSGGIERVEKERKVLSGVNLKLGGEWAKNLYDRAIPNFLSKYGKKWGAKVGTSQIGTGALGNKSGWESTGNIEGSKPATVHTLAVTPEMRASVLSEGQPLFSRAPDPIPPSTAKAVEFQVRPAKEGLPAYLRLNPEAAEAINQALGVRVNGVNIDPKMVPELVTRLKAEAEKLSGAAASNLWNLANAALENGSRDAGLVLVRARTNPADELAILHEELYHAAVQRKPGQGNLDKGVPHEEVAKDAGIAKMRPRIEGEIPGPPPSDVVVVAEAAADLAVGTYHELTPEEAETTSENYYSALAAAHGAEPLEAARSLFAHIDKLAAEANIIKPGEQFNVERNGPNRRALARVLGRKGTPESGPGLQRGADERESPNAVDGGQPPAGTAPLAAGDNRSLPSPQANAGTAAGTPALAGPDLGRQPVRLGEANAGRETPRGSEGLPEKQNGKELGSGAARGGAPPVPAPRESWRSRLPVEKAPTNLHSTQPIGLSDEELEDWSKSKGFRVEPAGEQLDIFGGNQPVMRVFRAGRGGKEQKGLVYQSQLDQLKQAKPEPTEPFALTGGESREEQPKLFGAGDLGEIIGSGKGSGITLPSRTREDKGSSLFSSERGSSTLAASPAGVMVEAAKEVGDYLSDVKRKTDHARDLQRGLETLDTTKQADILRGIQVMKAMKTAGMTKADDEAVYHHLEDPEGVKLHGNQDKWLDDIILPIQAQNEDLYTELTDGGVPIENYVHRVVKGKGGMLDRIAQGAKGVGGKGSLSKSAPQTKSRTYMALEDRDGKRMVVSVKGGQVTAWDHGTPENLGGISKTDEGQVFEDKDGDIWTLKQATTKEIEQHTETQYYHSALASSIASNIQLNSAVRAMRFLEAYKGSPEFKEIAWKGPGNPPKDWHPTKLPQFVGYYFEPRTSEVLDDYYDRMRNGQFGVLQSIQKFLRAAYLLNPIMHPLNVAASWGFEKGLTGFAPWKWKSVYRSGNKAVKAVLEKNQDFLDALDAGAALQSHREELQDVHKLFFDRLAEGLDKKESWAMNLAKSLGIEHGNFLNLLHKPSSIAAWFSSDVMYLQSAYQYQMEHPGVSLADALKEAGRIIPEYRLPARILDQRWLSKMMGHPLVSWFGAYHYGLLKSFGEAGKSALGLAEPPNARPGGEPGRGKAADVAKGWDRLAMLGLITMVLYPFLDKLAKELTGDEHARMRRSGPAGLVDAGIQVAQGKQSASSAIQKVVTPSPITKGAAELGFNRDFFTGHQIYDPHSDWQTQTDQIGHYLLGDFGVYGQYKKAETSAQKKRFFWQQGGIQFGKTRAEKTAADIAIKKVGTQAESPEDHENRVERREILDQLRQGNRKPLEDAEAKHELTHRQILNLQHRARLDPLEDEMYDFSVKEAEEVLDAARADKNEKEIKLVEKLLREKKYRARAYGWQTPAAQPEAVAQ